MHFYTVIEKDEERARVAERLEVQGFTVNSYKNLAELSEGMASDIGPDPDALLSTDLEILVKISFLVKSAPRMAPLLRTSIIYLGADGEALACPDALARKISSAISVSSIFSKYFTKISSSLHWPSSLGKH